MTIATATYAHQTAPWDAPLSLGVHAFIEYNGYIINDRHQADRIRVTKITGLDDADVSDSREVVPGDEGEFVYDSFARGRTFVMTGEIQAGALGTLKRLERDFKAAFGSLQESPMKFRWFDIFDSFDDAQTLQNYTAQIGSTSIGSLFPTGGVLRWGTTNQVLLTRSADNRLWADAQTTLRVVVGSVTDTSIVYIVPAFADSNNYARISLSIASGTPVLKVSTVIGGTVHDLTSVPVTGLAQAQSIWLRAKKEGDLLTAEVWTTPPAESSFPTFSTSSFMTGSDADLLGDQVLTQVGFGAQTTTAQWAFDDFQISTICPCDISFNAKKLSSLSITDSQDSLTRFKRAFQITMRASQPNGQCATQSRSQTLFPTSSGGSELGFTAPLTAPLTARSFVPGTVSLANSILSVCNRGTATERPLLVVFGATTGFTLVNLVNNQELSWSGSLADGDFLAFDCQRRTLVNSGGTNMKEFLSFSDSRWMLLEPQWNDIYMTGTGYSANTRLVCFSHGRWK